MIRIKAGERIRKEEKKKNTRERDGWNTWRKGSRQEEHKEEEKKNTLKKVTKGR